MATLPAFIGRYEIKSRIGRGGMGEVLLARDTNPNTARLVAIKLLSATMASPELRDRFAREARALAALSHPNIVGIYDSGEHEGAPYMVMEYVRGETLAEKIERRAPMTMAQKVTAMVELCAGLAHAHDAGLIHRDIKPANLMVDPHGRLKILDFGIARVAESNLTLMGAQLTQLAVRIGTPGYMSPEQIEGDEIDHRSDIFAVGTVCYELLSYREAFTGADTEEVEASVLKSRPPSLVSLVPGLDPEIQDIVARALEKDPAKRYQDAATLERAFERVRSRIKAASGTGVLPRPTPPAPQAGGLGSQASRAEVAYKRALAVYEEGAHRAARRYAMEALAENPDHQGAQALLAKIEPRRPAVPPPVQTVRVPSAPVVAERGAAPRPAAVPPATVADGAPPPRPGAAAQRPLASAAPTVIERPPASRPPAASAPTVLERGPAARWSPAAPPTTVEPAGRPAVLQQPGAPTLLQSAGAPTVLESVSPHELPDSWPPKLPPAPPAAGRAPAPRDALRPSDRLRRSAWWRHNQPAVLAGALVALVVAVLAVGVFAVSRWLWPSGQVLTITRPEGGTITGPGLDCGPHSSDCSATFDAEDTAELHVQAEAGFLFVGFTGDCAPSGRTLMTGPRTCGATFQRDQAPTPASTMTLTITPPTGGTILGIDVKCGTLGTDCSADLPYGAPVTLTTQADNGYAFGNFTGDCSPVGETQMNAPRTCGAVFRPSLPPGAASGGGLPPSGSRSSASGSRTPSGGGTVTSAPGGAVLVGPAPPGTGPGATGSNTAPVTPETPAPPPIAPEEQAKNEITRTLKAYCDAYKQLSFEAIRKVFPSAPKAFEAQIKQTRAITKCVFGELEYVTLEAEAGKAVIEAPLSMVQDMQVGGRQTSELTARINMSRPDVRADWRIDTINFRPK